MNNRVVYQIYLSSFNDTTGTGVGDLNGIIEKLDYIKSLNVDYIWITPFFQSPLNDGGYDIEDYKKINSIFGNKKDLLNLIKEAKKRDINIMLDMVFNHTSTEHKWFKGWISNEDKYKDFYISKTSKNYAPTNWKSKFGGSAWEEYEKNKWYLHLFDKTQADLNWKNPNVRKEVISILKYYIKLGIKGFRFDVINLISKGKYINDNDGDGRKYYTDGPKIHDYIKEISACLPKGVEFLTVGEMSSTNIKDCLKYANKEKTELDSVFTFHHLKVDYAGSDKFISKKPDIELLNNIWKEWYVKMCNNNSTMANFLNNHDQPRSVSRFIEKKYWKQGAKMLLALTASLPGILYIYQGEEIGMTNPNFKKNNQHKDVETLNYLNKHNLSKPTRGIKQKSRDNSRTPMQWNNKKWAGFSSAKPWIDISKNYKKINVENENKDNDSILNFYRDFISFKKKNRVFKLNKIEFNSYEKNIISFNRFSENEKYKFTFSFNGKKIKYNFTSKNVIYSNQKLLDNKLMPYQFIIEKK